MKSLDLHGLKHEEVDRIVENFVLLNEPPSTVITGISSVMQKLVIDVLKRHNISYQVNPWNIGQIIVLSW
jgi:hypothetical protein